jgi:putative transposase
LYNNLLYLEKLEYQLEEKFIFYNDLCKITKTEKGILAQVKQQIAKKLDASLRRFFKGRKTKNVGFPRFKNKYRYNSWTYTQHGFKFENGYLTLSGIGRIKVKEHRKLEGKIKTCIIKKEIDKWFVIFAVELPDIQGRRPDTSKVGLDLGCKDFITLSSGEKIENPKYLKQVMQQISLLQSQRDTTTNYKKGHKLSRKISKLHQKVHRQREDFLHKLSRQLCQKYSLICIEDLKTQKIIDKTKEKKSLRKSILDAGWFSFTQKLTYKVEETGSRLVKVNPRNTTKMCSRCRKLVPKELDERVHTCECGMILDRDHNAALNILRLGQESLRKLFTLESTPIL